jgi:dienelactone hydrolase
VTVRTGRREFVGLSVLALASAGRGTAAAQHAGTEIGAARSLAGFPEADFYGVAAEFDEIHAAQSRLKGSDLDAYMQAWNSVAADAEREADAFLEAGRRVSASESYLRAANYYSRSQQGPLRVGDGVRIMEPYQNMRRTWTKAWELSPPPFEPIRIPFRNTHLPGFFVPATACRDGSRSGVVIECSGSDHILERNYFRSKWRPFHQRGLSYLALDAPGQGEPLRLRKMYLEPDAETVTAAAIDFLAARSDVDMSRIGVFGTAFGGYAAARSGILPRVKAVVCRSASYDLWKDCYEYCPAFRKHLEYMLGVTGEAEARRALQPFTLDGLANRIRVPIAICHGAKDDVQDPRGAERLYDAIPSGQKLLKMLPNQAHGVGREAELEMIDWLVARLSAT